MPLIQHALSHEGRVPGVKHVKPWPPCSSSNVGLGLAVWVWVGYKSSRQDCTIFDANTWVSSPQGSCSPWASLQSTSDALSTPTLTNVEACMQWPVSRLPVWHGGWTHLRRHWDQNLQTSCSQDFSSITWSWPNGHLDCPSQMYSLGMFELRTGVSLLAWNEKKLTGQSERNQGIKTGYQSDMQTVTVFQLPWQLNWWRRASIRGGLPISLGCNSSDVVAHDYTWVYMM